jgi:hypothetical protein
MHDRNLVEFGQKALRYTHFFECRCEGIQEFYYADSESRDVRGEHKALLEAALARDIEAASAILTAHSEVRRIELRSKLSEQQLQAKTDPIWIVPLTFQDSRYR